MMKINSNQILSKKQILDVAPSVFTNHPSSDVTEKYTFISTEKVMDDMEELGWMPVEVKEVKARKKETIGYQKHLIVFRNKDIVIDGEDGDTVHPQI